MIKHKFYLFVFTATISLLVQSCSSKSTSAVQKTPSKGSETTTASANRPAGYAEGQLIYETKCIKCHAPKDLSQLSEANVKEIIPQMVIKANMKAGSTIINADEEKMLLDFALANCKKQ